MAQYKLTTIDNPFDPFENPRAWTLYDMQLGYNTPAYIDRIAKTSPEFGDARNEQILQEAIDEIVGYNVLGVYIKVTPEDYKDGRMIKRP